MKHTLNRHEFLKSACAAATLLATPDMTLGQSTKSAQDSIAERLGYAPDSRLLIITGDEFGETHSSTLGVIRSFEQGLLTSASLMIPCPWVTEAVEHVRTHPEFDVGVHLTLTGVGGGRRPKRPMRWRPLCSRSEAPGLYAPDGHMWPTGEDLWAHASPGEIVKECRAQIQRAIDYGIDVTHLDPHDGLYTGNIPEFCKIYADLGEEFRLPLRMGSQSNLKASGLPNLRAELTTRGVLMSDDWLGKMREGEDLKGFYLRRIREMSPGVMEFWTHPAVETAELKAATGPGWKSRVEDLRLLTADPDIRKAIEQEKVILIGWRKLRDIQRIGKGRVS